MSRTQSLLALRCIGRERRNTVINIHKPAVSLLRPLSIGHAHITMARHFLGERMYVMTQRQTFGFTDARLKIDFSDNHLKQIRSAISVLVLYIQLRGSPCAGNKCLLSSKTISPTYGSSHCGRFEDNFSRSGFQTSILREGRALSMICSITFSIIASRLVS